MSHLSDLESILDNPHAFGAPTFDEFRKNPDKYRRRTDEAYAVVQNAEGPVKHLITKQRLFFRSGTGKKYNCKTIDEVYKVAQDEGVPPELIDYAPEIVPQGNGRCEIHTTFFRKPVAPGILIAR